MGTQIILTGILHIKRVCTIPIHHVKTCRFSLPLTSESKVVGAEVRALASHQCGLGSNPGGGAICDLSFLLVFALPSRGFLLVIRYVSQHFHIPVPSEIVSGKQCC